MLVVKIPEMLSSDRRRGIVSFQVCKRPGQFLELLQPHVASDRKAVKRQIEENTFQSNEVYGAVRILAFSYACVKPVKYAIRDFIWFG